MEVHTELRCYHNEIVDGRIPRSDIAETLDDLANSNHCALGCAPALSDPGPTRSTLPATGPWACQFKEMPCLPVGN